MKGKVLILGRGFIGNRLASCPGFEISGRRILSIDDAEEEIKLKRPGVIVNCIGRTGRRSVDDCESDKNGTLLANAFVPLMLAEAAIRRGVKLVHISSGCIYRFDYASQPPLAEDAEPDFFNLFYSRTKIYSEEALKRLADNYKTLILRIRVPLDDRPHPKNLLTKLLKYEKVIDVPNSVTYIPDFLPALRHLLEIDASGVYNIVNKGGLRYPDLLEAYRKHFPGHRYTAISYRELNLVRTNVLLSVEKLEKTGFVMRDINEVLEECVKNYLRYS